MIIVRLFVLLVLLMGFVLIKRMWAQRRAGPPRVPAALRGDADYTWLILTKRSANAARDALAAHDPDAHIVTIDVRREPALAEAFRFRTAPTALLADTSGVVTRRLVGDAAIENYVRKPA